MIACVVAGAFAAPPGGASQSTYAKKKHIREIASWAFLAHGECSDCHEDALEWYEENAHAESIAPFLDKEPDILRIARSYGINEADIASGASVCMDCHSTVGKDAQGQQSRKMNRGVDCQGCHGAADRYLDPHQEEDAGRAYEVAVEDGMVPVRDLARAAETCASCHYVTDQRLLAAGHDSGKDFDFVAGMESVKHWERPLATASKSAQAFESEITKRGGVPRVQAISAPVSIPSAPVRTASSRPSRVGRTSSRGRVPAPRPAGQIRRFGVRVELPDFPQVPEDAAVHERIRLIHERLELLREQLERGQAR